MKEFTLPVLVNGLKQGDENAFNELYARYHKLVRYIALQLTKNHADAEEITQEVFLQVMHSIHDLRDPMQLKAWISRITYSKAKMLFRKKKDCNIDDSLMDTMKQAEEERLEFTPIKSMHYISDKEVLDTCLSNLKKPFREVLILYYFSQMSIKEIASTIERPEGTVKSRLLYAKQYLKEEIHAYENATDTKLDFKGKTLEAFLISYAGAMSPTISSPFITFKKITIPTSSAFMSMKMVGALVLAGGAGYGIYTAYQQINQRASLSNSSFPVTQIEQTTKTFTPIIYQGKMIHSPKQAYKELISFAHCEVEMKEKSEVEIEEIMPLYEALMQFGEGYSNLLHRNKWDDDFKKIIK